MRRRLLHCSTAALVFSLIAAGLVYSQSPEHKRIVLNLQETIEMAIAKSPEIREVHSEIASTMSDLDQVNAAFYPQLDATAITGPVRDAKEPLIVNNRITDPSSGLSFSSIGIFGRLEFTATQSLYTFGKLSNSREAAKHGVNAKRYRLDLKKKEIALRVTELYYGLVVARSGLDSVEESMDFFSDAAARIKNLLNAGSENVKDSDLYRVDAYRADTLRFKAEAEKGVRLSSYALKRMLQLPADAEIDTAEKNLAVRSEQVPALEDFIASAAEKRPEFKQLAEAISAKDFQVKAAESERYPSLFTALQGSLAGAPGRDSFHNQYITDEFNHAYAGIVAGAKWNFDFGITRAKINKARAELNKLSSTRAFADMSIPIEVAKNYQEHIEARQAVVSYQQAAVSSRKWVVTAMADFDMGVGTADEMLRAIEKYGDNQGKHIEALYRYNLSLAQLEYSAGMRTW